MLLASFGALPPHRSDIMVTSGKIELPDGARWLIGPFNIPDDNKEHTYSFTKDQLALARAENMRYSMGRWISDLLGETVSRMRYQCLMTTVSVTGGGSPCRRQWEDHKANIDIPITIWKGLIPLAKTKHPVTGEYWAFYVAFVPGRIMVTFKKVTKHWIESLFGAIWDFITTVVGAIVDTLGALFNFLAKATCLLCKPAIMAAGAYFSGGATMIPTPTTAKPAGMSDEEYKGQQDLLKAGVTKAQLDQMKTSPPTSTAGQSMADGVCNILCGAPNTQVYPAGSVTAFDPSFGMWRIAAPVGAPIVGLRGGQFGGQLGLADTTKTYVQIATSPAQPLGMTVVTLDEFNSLLKGPWWKRPSTIVLGIVGVLAVGGGAYYLTKPS